MFFRSFELIFSYLEEIDHIFNKNPDGLEREELVNKLLSLRNIMDHCIKYWLSFEERINEMQQKYAFSLPDVLPDDFWDDLEISRVSSDPEIEADTGNLFLKLKSEQGINSFRRGLGFWDLAMLEEAIREFEKVVELEPNFIFGHFSLGIAYSQKGIHEQAMAKLRLVKELSSDPHLNAFVHNTMGNIYVDEKNYQQAMEEFLKAAEEDPLFHIAYFNMGAIFFNRRQYKEAIEAFKKVLHFLPLDWEVCYYLGRAYTLSGNLGEGLKYFKKALSLNPADTKILFEMGVLYDLLGDKKSAAHCYNRIINKINQL